VKHFIFCDLGWIVLFLCVPEGSTCCPSYFITFDRCVLDYLRKFRELSTPVTGGLVSGNTCKTGQITFRALIFGKEQVFPCLNVEGVVFVFER
jgi:hypothetical protein